MAYTISAAAASSSSLPPSAGIGGGGSLYGSIGGASSSNNSSYLYGVGSIGAGIGTQAPSMPHEPPSALSSSLDALRSLVQKRLVTLDYLRRAHEGRLYWFNTILLTKDELLTAFEHSRMRSRTMRFAVLGMSLSPLLDISAAQDFLRGLIALLQEFESVPDDRFERRVQQKGLFRTASRPRKSGGGSLDFSFGIGDSGEASYLVTPNIPFELDYLTVFLTLCDLLTDVYAKISSFLGPSAHHSSHFAVPNGFPQPPDSASSASFSRSSGSSSSAGLSPALVEVVLKADGKLKKTFQMITRDLDRVARAAVKRELDSLEPMLVDAGF